MSTSIYALKDNDGNIRYIGKAVNPSGRLAVHISTAKHKGKGSEYHSSRWIACMLREGHTPIQEILEVVDDDGCEAERRWIAYGREQGWRLTNHTDGGEGLAGMKFSEETRKKLSEAAKKRDSWWLRTPEAIAKCAASRVGKPLSEERKRKISETKRGKYPESLQRPEVKQKASEATAEANRKRVWSAEAKQRLSESRKTHPMSEETKQKIALTMSKKRKEVFWSTLKKHKDTEIL